jgi:P-type Ca2+ transporter type 2C
MQSLIATLPPGRAGVAVQSERMDALLARVKADPVHGLTGAEAARRLSRYGKNEIIAPKGPNTFQKLIAQFANPIVLTLLVAAVIAIVDGASRTEEPLLVRFGDAIAILLIVVLNAVLGLVQERRAEAALDALQKMQVGRARAFRDGEVTLISAPELVLGDIVELEAGDAVPADVRLLQTANLATEESALTGESIPVGKDARAVVAADAPLGDQATMLFLGTTVVRGKGRGVVVATAKDTELGRLHALMQEGGARKTPLEKKLDVFGARILWACLALSALLFVRGLIQGDRSWHVLLLEAVSLAVAAIPEGLPAITTITLALGMQRMAARGALVRKLAAVETLGSATVICSDKTGTLTQNEMSVREVFAGGACYRVDGVGYEPTGTWKDAEGHTLTAFEGALRELIETAALCTDANLVLENGRHVVVGDPTEGALLALAMRANLPRDSAWGEQTVVKELPFDSDRKRMTIVTLGADGREVAHTKGSVDILLPLCTMQADNLVGSPLYDDDREAILKEASRMSKAALRVLAIARRELRDGTPEESSLEENLTFLGLVGMIDPPRVGAREAIAECDAAFVRAVMITGDHKLTAVAIATELGLYRERSVALSGSDLDDMSDEALDACVQKVSVFARVTAAQKLRIVRSLKRKGEVVAMTGDGVNDAPALREADIGVAMGKGGTDVAREAADMVLADDDFGTIVVAVQEGRAIYRNIQKFIFFLLSSNAGLLVAVFAASFIPGFSPLTPLMILWINLVTNGLPALALGIDPPDEAQMKETPRPASSGLLGTREYIGIAVVGVFMAAAALLAYTVRWEGGGRGFSSYEHASHVGRAVAFSVLALSPLFHAVSCRSATASAFKSRPLVSKPLVIAVALSAAIHMVVFIPALRPIFRTFAMSGSQWTFLLTLSLSIVPVMEVWKLVVRRTGLGADPPPPSTRAREVTTDPPSAHTSAPSA